MPETRNVAGNRIRLARRSVCTFVDATRISDEACERLLSGRTGDVDGALADLSWFLQEVKSVFCEPIPAAVKTMHPAAVAKAPAGIRVPKDSPTCKPRRSWWYSPKAAGAIPGGAIPRI
jgi:hypothetical protein